MLTRLDCSCLRAADMLYPYWIRLSTQAIIAEWRMYGTRIVLSNHVHKHVVHIAFHRAFGETNTFVGVIVDNVSLISRK